jgi:hypothetical protein
VVALVAGTLVDNDAHVVRVLEHTVQGVVADFMRRRLGAGTSGEANAREMRLLDGFSGVSDDLLVVYGA